jgi:hypothetical protein
MLTRRDRRGGRAAAAATAVGLAVALSACGSSSTHSHAKNAKHAATTPATTKPHVMLDTERVARAITLSIKAEKHLAATVACPPTVPQQKGHSFTCVATTHSRVNGKRVPVHTVFTVSQTNDLGNVYYQSPQ